MSNTPTPVSEDRTPVIVGVGEITDRPKEIADGLAPLELLEQALPRAAGDRARPSLTTAVTAARIASAHLVISRSGASTVSEVAVIGNDGVVGLALVMVAAVMSAACGGGRAVQLLRLPHPEWVQAEDGLAGGSCDGQLGAGRAVSEGLD